MNDSIKYESISFITNNEIQYYNWPSNYNEIWRHLTDYYVIDEISNEQIDITNESIEYPSNNLLLKGCLIARPGSYFPNRHIKMYFRNYTIDFDENIRNPNRGLWVISEDNYYRLEKSHKIYQTLANKDYHKTIQFIHLCDALTYLDSHNDINKYKDMIRVIEDYEVDFDYIIKIRNFVLINLNGEASQSIRNIFKKLFTEYYNNKTIKDKKHNNISNQSTKSKDNDVLETLSIKSDDSLSSKLSSSSEASIIYTNNTNNKAKRLIKNNIVVKNESKEVDNNVSDNNSNLEIDSKSEVAKLVDSSMTSSIETNNKISEPIKIESNNIKAISKRQRIIDDDDEPVNSSNITKKLKPTGITIENPSIILPDKLLILGKDGKDTIHNKPVNNKSNQLKYKKSYSFDFGKNDLDKVLPINKLSRVQSFDRHKPSDSNINIHNNSYTNKYSGDLSNDDSFVNNVKKDITSNNSRNVNRFVTDNFISENKNDNKSGNLFTNESFKTTNQIINERKYSKYEPEDLNKSNKLYIPYNSSNKFIETTIDGNQVDLNGHNNNTSKTLRFVESNVKANGHLRFDSNGNELSNKSVTSDYKSSNSLKINTHYRFDNEPDDYKRTNRFNESSNNDTYPSTSYLNERYEYNYKDNSYNSSMRDYDYRNNDNNNYDRYRNIDYNYDNTFLKPDSKDGHDNTKRKEDLNVKSKDKQLFSEKINNSTPNPNIPYSQNNDLGIESKDTNSNYKYNNYKVVPFSNKPSNLITQKPINSNQTQVHSSHIYKNNITSNSIKRQVHWPDLSVNRKPLKRVKIVERYIGEEVPPDEKINPYHTDDPEEEVPMPIKLRNIKERMHARY